ncbi:MAG: hypothetical protein A2X81_09995 [Desulfobacterales bacterium GWB2_56_26]|nr:MAG: hypothetical protein A2X81_09995 [Desulfobacterales bacterium GWB2_56_26]
MMAICALECILMLLVREYSRLFTTFTKSNLRWSRISREGQDGSTTHDKQRHNTTGKKFFQHVCSPFFESCRLELPSII